MDTRYYYDEERDTIVDKEGKEFGDMNQSQALVRILNSMDQTLKLAEGVKAQVAPMLEQVAPMLGMFGIGG
jgi:hypothetical protein